MTYRDQRLTCQNCGKEYIFRVEEQRSLGEMGLEIETPEQCPECRSEMAAEPGLRAGVVKWYRDDKHFGFVVQSDGSEVFFHRSGVDDDTLVVLQEGAPVWYELIMTDRGPQAINVHSRE